MKRGVVGALVGFQLIGAAVAQASTETKWVKAGSTWIKYTVHHHGIESRMSGAAYVALRRLEDSEARARALRVHENRLRAILRRSRAILARAKAIVSAPIHYSGAFPAVCVANAEEGGHNSWAGYFGFVYPPSAYGASEATYGSSWLNWPWGAQLQVALSLFNRYGGSAWGPLTRAKCGI